VIFKLKNNYFPHWNFSRLCEGKIVSFSFIFLFFTFWGTSSCTQRYSSQTAI